MKKKLLCAALSSLLMLNAGLVQAASGTVEISFAVGDSTLSINGHPVSVETPYIVGEGTTLVPLRVITEAFGAEVLWDADTKSITLSVDGIKILLQIDNQIATVNERPESLDAAPVLTSNGITMVPLRFLSETFGALVEYDHETRRITVTKETITNETIQGKTDLAYTGDSYFHWQINTPKSMSISYKSANGSTVVYTDAYENEIKITAGYHDPENDLEIDDCLEKMKASVYGLTLLKAETRQDADNNKIAHLKAKDKELSIEFLDIHAKDYNYTVSSILNLSCDQSVLDEIQSIMDSFKLSTSFGADVYDQSVIQNEKYLYQNHDWNFKVTLPAYLTLDEATAGTNQLNFYSENPEYKNTTYSIGIYSKTDTCTAALLASSDCQHNSLMLNPKIATVSQPLQTEVAGVQGIQYIIEYSGDRNYTMTDCFFEKGEYVYNVSIHSEAADQTLAKEILSSLSAEPLDPSEIGIMLRNDPNYSKPLSIDKKTFSLTAAGNWIEEDVSETPLQNSMCLLIERYSGSSASVSVQKREEGVTLSNVFKESEKNILDREFEKVGASSTLTLENYQFRRSIYKSTEDSETTYIISYITVTDDQIVTAYAFVDELYYNGLASQQFSDMMATLKLK